MFSRHGDRGRRQLWPCVGLFLLLLATGLKAQQQKAKTDNATVLLNPDERDLAVGDRQEIQEIRPQGVPGSVVLLNTLLMSMANCLGVLPFFFVKQLSKDLIGISNSIACGVMLACSFDLIHEGEPYGPFLVVIGILMGMLLVLLSQSFLKKYENIRFEAIEGANARKILLVLGIMSVHAVGEGAGVGVSYSGKSGWTQGLLVTLAIGLHNIPEGLAVSTVLIARGVSPRRAVLWNFACALPQALVALPAYLFVEVFTNCLPFALGFAAGCMIWVVFSELMPDAFENVSPSKAATAATISAIWLEGARMALNVVDSSAFNFSVLANDAFPHLMLAFASFVVCFFVRAIIGYQVSSTSLFGVGIGVGMQLFVTIVLFFRQLLWSPLPTRPLLVWMCVGGLLGCLNWQSFANRIIKDVREKPEGNRGHLPLSRKPLCPSSHAVHEFLWDPVTARHLCGLIGIGLLEGIHLGNALQVKHPSVMHSMAPAFLRASLFGGMLSLSLQPLRLTSVAAMLLSGLVAAIPCFLPVCIMMLNLQLSATSMQLSTFVAAFALSNSIRLLSLKSSPTMKAKAAWQTTTKSESVLETLLEIKNESKCDGLPSSHFQHSIGVTVGILIASGSLTLMCVL